MKRIGAFLARQPLGLVALLLVILGGSTAYAAGVRLAKNSVKSRQIKNGAVKPADLANRAVTTKKLRDGSVTTTKLANGAVLTAKLADGSVTGSKLAAGAVAGTGLANGSVNGAKIADGSVTGADIANGTIGAAELDPATVADVISKSGTLPNTGASTPILNVAGLGELRASCSPPNTLGMHYEITSPELQRVDSFHHDPTDNTPQAPAGVTSTAGGGVGYSSPNHMRLESTVWASTAERVLRFELFSNPSCGYFLRASLDGNDA